MFPITPQPTFLLYNWNGFTFSFRGDHIEMHNQVNKVTYKLIPQYYDDPPLIIQVVSKE